LNFVANRWAEVTKDPNHKTLENLPSDFWMNSIGGKTAKKRILGYSINVYRK